MAGARGACRQRVRRPWRPPPGGGSDLHSGLGATVARIAAAVSGLRPLAPGFRPGIVRRALDRGADRGGDLRAEPAPLHLRPGPRPRYAQGLLAHLFPLRADGRDRAQAVVERARYRLKGPGVDVLPGRDLVQADHAELRRPRRHGQGITAGGLVDGPRQLGAVADARNRARRGLARPCRVALGAAPQALAVALDRSLADRVALLGEPGGVIGIAAEAGGDDAPVERGAHRFVQGVDRAAGRHLSLAGPAAAGAGCPRARPPRSPPRPVRPVSASPPTA